MTNNKDAAAIRMVDVTQKQVTVREAAATCRIRMKQETVARVVDGQLEKGSALEVARVAAVLGAKKTPELVPLCHPITLGAVDTSFEIAADSIAIMATVRTTERTGVEMEAIVAAGAAAFALYDMIKSIDRGAEITELRLLHKSGGRSGTWTRQDPTAD